MYDSEKTLQVEKDERTKIEKKVEALTKEVGDKSHQLESAANIFEAERKKLNDMVNELTHKLHSG